MRFEILGPLCVSDRGVPVRVGGPREQKVLAALLLSTGRPLAQQRLAAVVWAEAPPATARAQIHNSVAALRRAFGARVRIDRLGGGFALDLAGHELDAAEFTRLVDEATRLGDAPAAVRCCNAALALWRGPALDGLAHGILSGEAQRLEEGRLTCLERRLALEVELGAPDEVIGELAALAAEHPLRERIVELRMRALCRAGRRPEALRVYADARRLLAEELGLDPSPALQQLHAAILNSATTRVEPRQPAAVPRQLPAAPRHFVGRLDELRALDRLADAVARDAAIVISAIAGMPGVGKTALAVHWAHLAAHRFPDGQLYVNLHGFDPTGPPVEPAVAIRGFLDAFGVERIPPHPDAQAALFRSLVAGRRVLVVLDNAHDDDQVRPLLPGSQTCLVLATSRRQLTSLVVAEGALPMPLDVLAADDARRLLRRHLGERRVTAEPAAEEMVIDRCARLPLALAIAAARAAVDPTRQLATVAAELADAQDRLDALDAGTPATSVRAAFSWSYRELTTDAQRLFRLLGAAPGPDIATRAAASMAGSPVRQVRKILAELGRAHLVAEHVPGRFALHDLLRAYAVDLASVDDAAVRRTLDFYLHTAHAAALVLDPHRDAVPLAAPGPGVVPDTPADHDSALRWFTAEYAVLLAAVRQAADLGYDAQCWQLAWSLNTFFDRSGRWHDWAGAQEVALAAAERLSDRPGQARVHRGIAGAYLRLGHDDEATRHLQCALDLFRDLDDHNGQARTHYNLASLFERRGSYPEALQHARQARDLFQVAGQWAGHLQALNIVGWCHSRLGDHQQAVICCRRALTQQREIGDRRGEAATWDSLGYAQHHLGRLRTAIRCYEHALRLLRELGCPFHEADTLTHLGDAHETAGDIAAARGARLGALAILEGLGHPDAAQVRDRLGRAGQARLADRG